MSRAKLSLVNSLSAGLVDLVGLAGQGRFISPDGLVDSVGSDDFNGLDVLDCFMIH